MSRIRRFILVLAAASVLVGVPLAWWFSLRRTLALTAPNGRYSLHLTGRFGRPIFGVDHRVYASVFDGSNEVVSGHQIHSGDWMDPWFDLYYPRHVWVNDNMLRLTRPEDEALNEYDQITVRNYASRTVRIFRISCRDMFLLLDITPDQVVILRAPMQGRYAEYSWLEVDGQFEDERDLETIGKNFTVSKRGARYNIDILDDRVELSLADAVKGTNETAPNKALQVTAR